MSEPIRDLPTAVRELGALPMPAGPKPQTRSVLDRARAALGARMAKDDLRLVLGNVIDYAAELEAERHSTNESLSAAAEQLRVDRDRIAEYERLAAEAAALELPGTALEHVQAVLLAHFGELPRPDMAVGLLLTNLRAEWEAEGRARIAELEALVEQATEFRVWEPGYGLYVRRAPGTTGFAVMEARRTDKGRRVWTTAGWQYSALLSDAELFCWPDAQTAVAEARRVMPGVVGDEGLSGPCDCGEGAVHYTAADCPAARRAAAETGGAQ